MTRQSPGIRALVIPLSKSAVSMGPTTVVPLVTYHRGEADRFGTFLSKFIQLKLLARPWAPPRFARRRIVPEVAFGGQETRPRAGTFFARFWARPPPSQRPGPFWGGALYSVAGGGACFPIGGSMSADSASLPAVIRDRPRVLASACGKTDIGRQRDHNEDQFLLRPEHDLFVVCDGMGGNNAGEVASALAATSLCNFFEATAGGDIPGKIEKEDEQLSTAARR